MGNRSWIVALAWSCWSLVPTLILGVVAPAAAAPPGSIFVAATWDDNSVHFLDANLNDLGSFPAAAPFPNGLATDPGRIFSGHFSTQQVVAYDLNGNVLFTWFAPIAGLQGMEIVNGELAIADSSLIEFYSPDTGAFIRSIPSQGGGVEGLAFDGAVLWQLDDNLVATDPSDGSVVNTIPNAALGCAFSGTGVTIAPGGPGQLVLACADGRWFRVSSVTGAVLDSGNNGLNMFGLKVFEGAPTVGVPSMSHSALIVLGAVLCLAGALRARSIAHRRAV